MHRAASPMAKSLEVTTHTNQSDNLLSHRYSWPNRHTKHGPGEQHCSNYRSANGLCLHKLLQGGWPWSEDQHPHCCSLTFPLSVAQDRNGRTKQGNLRIKSRPLNRWRKEGTYDPQTSKWLKGSHSLPSTSMDTLHATTTIEDTHTSPHSPSSTSNFYCQVSSCSCISSQPLSHLLSYSVWGAREKQRPLCCASTLQQ